MRSERLYLTDIVEAADIIEQYVDGRSLDDFLQDRMLRDAVLLRLITIGEAASRLSREFRQRHDQVEWSDIVAFRNFAVHAYFGIIWDIVWRAATRNTPLLRGYIASVLAQEYPGTDDEASSLS